MKLQLIRNATLRLEYAGSVILIDPLLGPKHSYPSYVGIEDNPTVGLPIPTSEVLAGVDLIILSHLHGDHFDAEAQNIIDKTMPILCQPGDKEKIETYGFNSLIELESETQRGDVNIARTGGEHGTGKWAERLNPVSGFVFQAPDEPTVYWIGDSVWCEEVKHALDKYQPDVIISHSGGAELGDSGPIIMDAAQTIALCETSPSARVIATHLEALDHCKTSRKALQLAAEESGIDRNRLLIPEDGERIEIN
jgi:L-ascorbate metabolism protein UlaG (beta-lactamase superfamily)